MSIHQNGKITDRK